MGIAQDSKVGWTEHKTNEERLLYIRWKERSLLATQKDSGSGLVKIP